MSCSVEIRYLGIDRSPVVVEFSNKRFSDVTLSHVIENLRNSQGHLSLSHISLVFNGKSSDGQEHLSLEAWGVCQSGQVIQVMSTTGNRISKPLTLSRIQECGFGKMSSYGLSPDDIHLFRLQFHASRTTSYEHMLRHSYSEITDEDWKEIYSLEDAWLDERYQPNLESFHSNFSGCSMFVCMTKWCSKLTISQCAMCIQLFSDFHFYLGFLAAVYYGPILIVFWHETHNCLPFQAGLSLGIFAYVFLWLTSYG